MPNPYKLASTGVLLLLIQIVLVLVLVILLAVSVGTQNPQILTLFKGAGVLGVIPFLLLGVVGKILCLCARSTTMGRVCVALSLFFEGTGFVVPFLNLPTAVTTGQQFLPTLFFLAYLVILAKALGKPDIIKIVLSSLGCLAFSGVTYFVMRMDESDLIRIGGSVVVLVATVYGLMLYIRSLVYLRRAIDAWVPPEMTEGANPNSVEQ